MVKKEKNNFWSGWREQFVWVVVMSVVVSAAAGFIAGLFGLEISKSLTGEKERTVAINQEEPVVDVVRRVSPAVVSIIITKEVPISSNSGEGGFLGLDDFFGQFFNEEFFAAPEQFEKREVGGGSGFIVSADGLILTNKHVVEDEEAEYTVLTSTGEEISARVLARDPVEDIAVLKIDKNNLPVIELGDSDSIEIGQAVIAIGNALDEFRNTVSTGVVSGLMRSITTDGGSFGQSEQLSEVIQTDAAINPGNSGGPLLNLKGQAIGINVAVARGAENIGFSLPINKARRDIAQIKGQGKISYPLLGVRYVPVTKPLQKENNLPVDYGALIVPGRTADQPAISPDSPADKAGLAEGDIILEIDGQRIDQIHSLAKVIQKHEIGDRVSVKFLREGEEKVVEVELVER